MKIRKLTPENYVKVSALLQQSFPGSAYETQLVENLRQKGRAMHEWVCVHINKIIAYIAFTNAYNGSAVCGLHLAPLAVKPEFQRQGIGSDLLRFALRQDAIKDKAIFVLGAPEFYQKFGFEPCAMPHCPFDKKNSPFLSIRNTISSQFTVGYESEFKSGHVSGPRGSHNTLSGRKRKKQLP